MKTNEPVAWMVNGKTYADIFEAEHHSKFTNKPMIPLYTHPHSEESVKAKTLTDEEIYEIAMEVQTGFLPQDDTLAFARAILRKAQEK
jgi:hypothetical protein